MYSKHSIHFTKPFSSVVLLYVSLPFMSLIIIFAPIIGFPKASITFILKYHLTSNLESSSTKIVSNVVLIAVLKELSLKYMSKLVFFVIVEFVKVLFSEVSNSTPTFTPTLVLKLHEPDNIIPVLEFELHVLFIMVLFN